MLVGEDWFIRSTAWLALIFYVAAEALLSCPVGGPAKGARWLHSAGCAAMIIHIALAFHLRHSWSHEVAYSDTARQTAAVTGLNWGGGIYINYFFALLWLSIVTRWWRKYEKHAAEGRWQAGTLRAFFLFMFFNAAFIFVPGFARWFGLLCCVALVFVWLRPRCKKSSPVN